MMPDGWGTYDLNKLVEFLDEKRKPIKSENRANMQGLYPYYGATGIIDWINDYIFDDDLILMGEDGENILSRNLPHVFCISGKTWVNNHAHVLKANNDIDHYFLATYLESLDYRKYNSGSTQPKLNKAICKKIKVKLPPLPEQRKIAQILVTWDKAIATTEKLIYATKKQKKALMQQLFSAKKRLINQKTGKNFDGQWKNVYLSNITIIKKGKALSTKNIVHGNYPVIAGGKNSPYSHAEFTHENVVTVSASGAYAGYVSYHKYKIWASDCLVIVAKSGNDLNFVFHWLQLQQDYIYAMQSGGAQPHIYPKDLNSLKLWVPKFAEQQKIVQILKIADQKIELLATKLAYFKQEKKALMQQLLTGKRRVFF